MVCADDRDSPCLTLHHDLPSGQTELGDPSLYHWRSREPYSPACGSLLGS